MSGGIGTTNRIWLERTKGDSVLKVSVVNIEDNPDYYRDWQQLGIVRQKDRTDPNQIIEGNEQSLALIGGLERPVDRSAALLRLADSRLGTCDRPEPQPLLEEMP